MSLSLQESCRLYERHARRQKNILSFADFNNKHFTCLPADAETEAQFKRVVSKAGKASGWPIRARLTSLHRSLLKSDAVVASTLSAVVPSASNSFVTNHPSYSAAIHMNIRPPEEVEEVEEVEEAKEWTVPEYIAAVRASDLKENKGLMVHLVPTHRGAPLSSLASKLTKNTWEALRDNTDSPIKMKDGSLMDLREYKLNVEDVKSFVQNRKKKVEGPYFIRFSGI